jgi:nucleotide-binding universal stress UspA family protein
MGFSTILVPHDGSKPSDKALDTAIELVKMSKNPHILLLHVIPEMEIPPVLERPIRSRKTGETTTTTETEIQIMKRLKVSVHIPIR